MPPKRSHRTPAWAYLYDREAEGYEQLRLALSVGDVGGYHYKLIKSGDLLELEVYPKWYTRAEERRAERIGKTRLAQQVVNDRNARKTIIRKVNANFKAGDYWVTCTFDDAHLPADDHDAKRQVANYMRRVGYHCGRRGLPRPKYLYVIEHRGEGSPEGPPVRYHVHLVVEGLIDRDAMEDLWSGGGRVECHRLQPDSDGGFVGLATYISKMPSPRKRWGCSKGLADPIVRAGRLSKKRVLAMARDYAEAAGIIAGLPAVQKLCPGARILTMDPPKTSDYVAGVYLYLRIGGNAPPRTKSGRRNN